MKLCNVSKMMNLEYTVISVINCVQNDFIKIILNHQLIPILFVKKSYITNVSYYCSVCDKTIKLKSKNKHFNSNIHKEFDRLKHIKLTIENPNINDIGEIFYAYLIEHNKKYDFNLLKCEFKLIFNDNQ